MGEAGFTVHGTGFRPASLESGLFLQGTPRRLHCVTFSPTEPHSWPSREPSQPQHTGMGTACSHVPGPHASHLNLSSTWHTGTSCSRIPGPHTSHRYLSSTRGTGTAACSHLAWAISTSAAHTAHGNSVQPLALTRAISTSAGDLYRAGHGWHTPHRLHAAQQ